MKHTVWFLAAFFPMMAWSQAKAAPLDAQAIDSAPLSAVPVTAPTPQPKEPIAALVKLQVLLDRSGVSPGVIDGHDGDNFRKAIEGFEALNGLPVDGKPDAEMLGKLNDELAITEVYKITDDDGKDLVDSIPKDYAEQAQMKNLGYTSIAEKLSERFHMDIDLLKALNPNASFSAGESVTVVIPGDPKTGTVKKIEAHRKRGQVFAFAQDGSLLAVYPATIGSEETPSPTGRHKVKGVAKNPPYSYNPKINFQQGNNTKKLTLPSGPNGPVGTVWIDLTEPTYGIHGTPEPQLIDKAGSHGCIRLTNWDAQELAGMVKPGVIVEFVD